MSFLWTIVKRGDSSTKEVANAWPVLARVSQLPDSKGPEECQGIKAMNWIISFRTTNLSLLPVIIPFVSGKSMTSLTSSEHPSTLLMSSGLTVGFPPVSPTGEAPDEVPGVGVWISAAILSVAWVHYVQKWKPVKGNVLRKLLKKILLLFLSLHSSISCDVTRKTAQLRSEYLTEHFLINTQPFKFVNSSMYRAIATTASGSYS